MPRYRVDTSPDNCTGCLRCALACSDLHTGAFNPSAARIRVVIRGASCEISFTETCTSCGICADSCLYGALVKKAQEEIP